MKVPIIEHQKIPITKIQKIQLLKCIRAGTFDPSIFPDLFTKIVENVIVCDDNDNEILRMKKE